MEKPIIQDTVMLCPTCRTRQTHRLTVFTDEEIRTCSNCGTKTITKFESNVAVDEFKKVPNRTPPAKKLGRPKKKQWYEE